MQTVQSQIYPTIEGAGTESYPAPSPDPTRGKDAKCKIASNEYASMIYV